MDFLIVFKWLKVWDERVGVISPERWAPSIIGTMMNIGLSLGQTVQFLILSQPYLMGILICGVNVVTHLKILSN